jgi:hypothetical protein
MAFNSRYVPRQVGTREQVLAQQPIGVLVGAPLPWAVRIGKEDLDGESVGQALVLSPLFPSIVRQGFPQQGGHMPECLDEALSGTRRIRPLHPCQEDQARRPFHQGADGRAIASPLDEVAFPVAGHRAGGHFGRTLGNGRHMGNLAAPIDPADAPCAPDAAPPTARSAGLRGAAHRAPHRSSRPRDVYSCRQDTRVGDVRQSVQASSPESAVSGHTATAGVQEYARSSWLAGARMAATVCAIQAR